MTQQPTLVIMAAGMGSRYGGLKQIDPVGPNGEMIIEYAIFDALRAGFGKVVFVIKKEIETVFREKIGRTIEGQCDVSYVFQRLDNIPAGFLLPPERKKPWGTGHAILTCKDVVHGPFAVINADDFYGRTSFAVMGDYLRTAQDQNGRYDYCMVGYRLENTLTEHGHVARGICSVDEAGYLTGVVERTQIQRFGETIKYTEDGGETWVEIPGETLTSLNIWGFTPGLFAELETRFERFLPASKDNIIKAEFFIPNIVGDLAAEGKAAVKVLPTTEQWFGVTYQPDKERVKRAIENLVERGVYSQKLWSEAT